MKVVRTFSDAKKIENLKNLPPGLAEDVLKLFEGIYKSRSDEEERLEDFELDPGRGGFVAVLTGYDFDNDLGSKVREVGLNSAGDLTSFAEFVERLHCPDTIPRCLRADKRQCHHALFHQGARPVHEAAQYRLWC